MNIFQLRQALIKTAKIIAGKNVRVVMEGFAPKVVFDTRTRRLIEIHLPQVPEGATPDLIQAIQGYIDHECAHVLLSDHADICDTTKNKLWHYIHNSIDDVFINREIQKTFVGAADNIRSGYLFMYEGKWPRKPGEINAYDRGNMDEAIAAIPLDPMQLPRLQFGMTQLFFASKMGDTLAGDKYDELDLDRIYQPLIDKADPAMVERLKNCKTTKDVRELTEYWSQFFSKEVAEEMLKGDGDGEGGRYVPSDGQIDNMMKEFKSFEEQIANGIQSQVQKLMIESREGIYWTDRFDQFIDKETIAKNNYSKYATLELATFEEETKQASNYLAKDLRRLLEERRRRYYIGGYKSGKMNAKSLYSVRCGNDRIFKKKNEVRDINSAVSLVIDLSGSMQGEKVYIAMQSAYALAMVLEQLKVPYEIVGFSTSNPNRAMMQAYEEFVKGLNEDTKSKIINDGSPETIWVFKGFEESFDYTAKSAILAAAGSGVGMAQNEDSKHVKLALERLRARSEPVKALFVFSDGSPSFCGNSVRNSANQLRYLAHNAKTAYGVDVYGIGIATDSVANYYPKNKVVRQISELPNVLFSFLKDVI